MSFSPDLSLLRRSFELAMKAREAGNHPFGALLVGPGNVILLEAENTVYSDRDVTGHAELNAARQASKELESETIATATMYASTEPCPMCAGAIHWSGVGRLVYGLSQERLYQLTKGPNRSPPLRLSCRAVLSASDRQIEIYGPLLQQEAEAAHRGFWE